MHFTRIYHSLTPLTYMSVYKNVDRGFCKYLWAQFCDYLICLKFFCNFWRFWGNSCNYLKFWLKAEKCYGLNLKCIVLTSYMKYLEISRHIWGFLSDFCRIIKYIPYRLFIWAQLPPYAIFRGLAIVKLINDQSKGNFIC